MKLNELSLLENKKTVLDTASSLNNNKLKIYSDQFDKHKPL